MGESRRRVMHAEETITEVEAHLNLWIDSGLVMDCYMAERYGVHHNVFMKACKSGVLQSVTLGGRYYFMPGWVSDWREEMKSERVQMSKSADMEPSTIGDCLLRYEQALLKLVGDGLIIDCATASKIFGSAVSNYRYAIKIGALKAARIGNKSYFTTSWINEWRSGMKYTRTDIGAEL
jgi:hypothetical protein